MARHASAMKRARQSEKRRLRNRFFRGAARKAISKARVAIDTGETPEAREAVILAVKALDKAAEKGVIHKNNAARRKSRLMKRLAALNK